MPRLAKRENDCMSTDFFTDRPDTVCFYNKINIISVLCNFHNLLKYLGSWSGNGIGIGWFCPRKMGFKPMGMGKKCQKSKMGIEFEHCEVGFRKRNELWNGTGILPLLLGPSEWANGQ